MNDNVTIEKSAAKKRGLGRGLNALFEDEESTFTAAPPVAADTQGTGLSRKTLGLDQLEPGSYQPRRHMDDESIKELAASIKVHGVLQPLIVRPKRGFNGVFEIIAGERRFRASQKAQLHEVPVIIMDLDDQKTLEVALIENLQRADLNPIEEAQGYVQMIEEFGRTQEKVAEALGKSRSHVANMVRLLTLPPKVVTMLREGQLTAGHARALITAQNPEELAQQIINNQLTVRDTENLVSARSGKAKKGGAKAGKAPKDVDTIALEKEIGNMLGMKVSIDMRGGKGGGAIKVDFKTLDQLDEVLRRLSHNPGRHHAG